MSLTKSDGKKKEQTLQLLEAEEIRDEAAAKQNEVNKRRSKEAYAKKQQERRAAKRAENQQKSRSPIKTQVQGVEMTQQAGSADTMTAELTLTDATAQSDVELRRIVATADSSTNQAIKDVSMQASKVKMNLNNLAGSPLPVVPAQSENDISHATEIDGGISTDKIDDGLSWTKSIPANTITTVPDPQTVTTSTEQPTIISSPQELAIDAIKTCTDAPSPNPANGLDKNRAKSDGAHDNNLANIGGQQTNSSEPQTATEIFHQLAAVRLQTSSSVRPDADLTENAPNKSRAQDISHSQGPTEIRNDSSNKLHAEKANVSTIGPQDNICSPAPLSEVRVRLAFNWWDDVEMAELLDSEYGNDIVAEASEPNGAVHAYGCFDEDIEMEIGDVPQYQSTAAWIQDGLTAPASGKQCDAMEVDEAGDGDGVANWSFMSQPANDAWSPGKPQWSTPMTTSPMDHSRNAGQPAPSKTHQLESIPVIPVSGQVVASAAPKVVRAMELACVANHDLELLTKLRDTVVASQGVKGKSTMPSKGSPVTPLRVPQIVEKFPVPSRDPSGIPSPARPKMLPVETHQPLPLKNRRDLFLSPRACKIYPIRHGGQYGKVKKPQDNAAACISTCPNSNQPILGKLKRKYILPGMLRHYRILDDGTSQFLMQCGSDVSQKIEDRLIAVRSSVYSFEG